MSINGTIGNLAYYREESVVLGKSAAFISLEKNISKTYIYYVLRCDRTKSYYELELTGSTIRNLSLKAIKETPIALPSKNEQKCIANILYSLDSEIQLKAEALNQRKLLKKALMQDLLTGNVRVNVEEGL